MAAAACTGHPLASRTPAGHKVAVGTPAARKHNESAAVRSRPAVEEDLRRAARFEPSSPSNDFGHYRMWCSAKEPKRQLKMALLDCPMAQLDSAQPSPAAHAAHE